MVLNTFSGDEVIGTKYRHPLYDRKSPVLAGGDYITTEAGTGLVHTAPGHGQEDYLTGLKAGLELLSPVDDVGKFTIEAGERFAGMKVLDEGNTAIIDALTETGSLLKVEDYPHKYPYDWRTKKPTIFRATDQWFASVEGFREEALNAVDTVSFELQPPITLCRLTSLTLLIKSSHERYNGCQKSVRIELTHLLSEEEIGVFPVRDPGEFQSLYFMTGTPEMRFCWTKTPLNIFKQLLLNMALMLGGQWMKANYYLRNIEMKLTSGRREQIPWMFGSILGLVGQV